MSILERIKMLAKEQGTNIKEIERQCGIGNATIRRWEINSPSLENVKKVAHLLHVTIDYLTYGNKDASTGLTITEDEADLLTMYRALDDGGKEDIFILARTKYERSDNRKRGYTSSTYTGSNGNSGPDEDFDASNGTA